MDGPDFNKLAEKIDRLLAQLDELAQENQKLKQEAAERDRIVRELKEKAAVYEQERGQIRERVNALIGRIDQGMPSET
jgi:FtsZ-binding cell division protein ZapB